MTTCLLCDNSLTTEPILLDGRADTYLAACVNCGRYLFDGVFAIDIPVRRAANRTAGPLASHMVRRLQRDTGAPPEVSATNWDRWVEEHPFPSPFVQAENLLLLVAAECPIVGQLTHVDLREHQASVGALDASNFAAVIDYVIRSGLLDGNPSGSGATVGLSFQGWARVEELNRTGPRSSNRAFMAMPFGNADLNLVYRDAFKLGARNAGFELERLDEHPKAGLIDDHLRVEIRRARFLVVDLTHGNPGAYWEAGFAEGLGKPTIYTCRSDVFAATKTHFDTNHMHTVTWQPDRLDDAAARLADTIRATLPDEATMDAPPKP